MVTLSPKLVMLTAASPLSKLVISAGRYPRGRRGRRGGRREDSCDHGHRGQGDHDPQCPSVSRIPESKETHRHAP
jgi:hypothetical protein